MPEFDVMVIGAGAAGRMCPLTAGARGRRVLMPDHANRVGKKILMSVDVTGHFGGHDVQWASGEVA